jgi:hypothetical protein
MAFLSELKEKDTEHTRSRQMIEEKYDVDTLSNEHLRGRKIDIEYERRCRCRLRIMRPLIEDVQEKGNRFFRNNFDEERDTHVRKNSTSAVGVHRANIQFFLPKKKTPSHLPHYLRM